MKLKNNEIICQLGTWSWIFSPKDIIIAFILFLLMISLAFFALTTGKFPIEFSTLIDIVVGQSEGGIKEKIVMDIRLPRLLTAMGVGAALGISGAIFQSISRNVLGSPDVIGFTTGAATGALLQIIIFNGTVVDIAISTLIGGMATALIVYLLSLKNGVMSGYTMILIGIGVGAILHAFNGLLLVKGNIDNAIMANLWLAGSLNARTWQHVYPTFIGLLILVPLIIFYAKSLTLMEMGDDMAQQLGVHVGRVRWVMIFSAVLLASLATASAGPIAFVALAAPQLVIRLSHSGKLPIVGSALMGALLLLSADVLSQSLPINITMPVGLMTGVIGGLYLLWLLTRKQRT
ncbi:MULTISPECIES: FecCD family ABC transporter permease [Proteus]|uniref:FecCD family ABC transporter permease n=1 Tax=Proteus TaxID=583 RepID=UPI000BFE76AA|nr:MULTISPECIES: iron chelate uptake ABC transporter family permease subunit [Proteus]ATM98947.1 Fe(3+)-siderophore ABC transporter permease [Proteus vulgaris]MBG2837078.1 iron chelate uptake ABC transporter family permease subunit [Proteus terrae subsp. cibarius]MBG2868597.1 iron chelate uptake ABC transporter family permease subunit [Proteus terrae subsp. cibarius]MBG3090502.1 iron chelate uptake ABC transporter family permease subunit [Proteus terrae subsp. cibarius]MBJ2109776.1 iron chelat